MNKINIDIKTSKNLLAFSAGVDSTALFFILLENNIPFDIAIVDYNQRAQSKEEVIYATQLAHKYNKKCFIKQYDLEKFSEKAARDFRYNFFEEIIKNESYEALITAHQLNDKLEWFLMQLTKGAGINELMGMDKVRYKNDYLILKPLLEYSKDDLTNYLKEHNIKYFIDETNSDEKYTRNFFRHNFSDKLLEKYQDGIKKSFEYIQTDRESLLSPVSEKRYEEFVVFTYNGDINIALNTIDKEIKKRGLIISKATRDEIKRQKQIVISNKISVALTSDKIFIAPYVKTTMDKKFKERCRTNHIPANIRGYLSTLPHFQFFD
ncbi:MAG: tRNA lysidine(34) synthetase TilS [Campylobacterota bacterium]|nr:tRNA lysidine(34) synthetase TilS [Campylobacterota bacterium]